MLYILMSVCCLLAAEFSFDGFSADLTRSMVAMSDVSLLIANSVNDNLLSFANH